MKHLLLAACLGLAVFSMDAQPLKVPAPSPGQTIKQDFGLSSIELSYSRPGVKGRKIFGDVRPYGILWRTGANGPTTISFGDDVTIGGTLLKAGKYGLLTIPDKDNWIIIITRQLNVTASPDDYKKENDVVRVNLKPLVLKEPVETFTMQFANIKPNSLDLQLTWETTSISLPITTDIDTKVMAQISDLMNKDNRPYFNAAMYYMDNGKDLNKALEWFNKADQDPKAYWVLYQKAVCLAKLGKKEEAKATALKSVAAAKEEKNEDYVALNEKLMATLK